MDDIKTIEDMVRRRLRNIVSESLRFEITPPTHDDILMMIRGAMDGDNKCAYCGQDLVLRDTPPYRKVYSIDHRLPLSLGGDNRNGNLVVCCHGCNIIKGTMRAETYERLIKLIVEHDPALLSIMFDEMWRGKLANKMERKYGDRPEGERE